jgi:DnaK suppressor protein
MPNKTVKTTTAKQSVPAKAVKPAAKPAVKTMTKPAKAPAKVVAKPATKASAPSEVSKPKAKSSFDAKSLAPIREMLLKMRDRLTGQISTLSDDSLKYKDDGSSEDRTDDFDREFALNLVSSEHDAIFEIDGAMRRIEEGVYGLCDACGCSIEKARLHALPFARMCLKCQSEAEKGRSRFRPFGETLAQGVEQAPDVAESEEVE